jgi:hypothetical protein
LGLFTFGDHFVDLDLWFFFNVDVDLAFWFYGKKKKKGKSGYDHICLLKKYTLY